MPLEPLGSQVSSPSSIIESQKKKVFFCFSHFKNKIKRKKQVSNQLNWYVCVLSVLRDGGWMGKKTERKSHIRIPVFITIDFTYETKQINEAKGPFMQEDKST